MANINNNKIEPSTTPHPDCWDNLSLGSSFKDDPPSSKFCTLPCSSFKDDPPSSKLGTLPHEFMLPPSSIDKNQPETLNKIKDNKVTVEVHSNIPGKRKMVFEGTSSDYYKENEAVLPFDDETFRLERLHQAVKRQRVWLPGESAAAVPASVSYEFGSPQFEKGSKFQNRNYKNGFLAVPVEVERIEITDFNASGSRKNIRKCKTLATTPQKEDDFSGLPMEVVLNILSHLTLKEAVGTSILSRSWKDLWKAYSGCLDFDAPSLTSLALCHPEFHYEAACRYTVWVDNVLDSHQWHCQTIQGLRIAFHMNKRFSGSIDRWIDFAISKDVECLVLDLSPFDQFYRDGYGSFYAFPAWLLYEPFTLHPFDRLTSLELRFVCVQDEVIQYISCNCHMLQRLSLEEIPYLKNFRLDNSLPELKHLEISICPHLLNVYISARHLTSFKYNSRMMVRTNMVFGDVPQLSVLVLGGSCYHVVLDNLPFNLSRLNHVSLNQDAPVCLSQEFANLTLPARPKGKNAHPLFVNPDGRSFGGSTICFWTLKRFLELKHLELNIKGYVGDSILCSGTFLHGSTYLEKLVLKLTWRYPPEAPFRLRDHPIKMKHVCKGCKNKCLKELVYVGWLGLDAEVEILEVLIESAGSTLERITINLCHSHNDDKDAIKFKTSSEKDNAKARAMQLQQKLVSSKAKLIII